MATNSPLKIVLTNDDGVDAPGIRHLETAVAGLGDLFVVAPVREVSGWGHRVTTHSPILVTELGPRRFSIEGTSADCTRIALAEIVPDADLVLGGINAGANLGADVFMSGTIAATREAVLMGRSAIALSQYQRKEVPLDWERARRWTRDIVTEILDHSWERGGPAVLWSATFPALCPEAEEPKVVECPVDINPLEIVFEETSGQTTPAAENVREYMYRGVYDRRPRTRGSDVDVCLEGSIALSRVQL